MAERPEPDPRPVRAPQRALASLALFVAGWLVVAWRMEPPRARDRDAPAPVFSAERALATWRALPGSAVPHPVGSTGHAELRGGLVAELARLGYAPEVQETLVAAGNFVCAVRNVLARLPGTVGGKALLLAAHYDSVPAGPGAGDDGAGVASLLEIARALKQGPPLEQDVILLIDDGEELGLFGARAFAEQHAWARDVGTVINLEARGTSGPCFLFETSDENAALITLAAQVLAHPAAWSASYEVYQRMPNDTDLTVFKGHGWQGYNLAFLRGLRHYHTPRDEAASLSADSVQQMGENALALARGVAQGRLDRGARGRAVYADFLDLVLLHWNERANLPIALGLTLALGFALWTRFGSRRWRPGHVLSCAGLGLLLPVLAAGLASLAQMAALAGNASLHPPAAEPLWMRAALGACAVAAACALAGLPRLVRTSLEERWAGLALGFALGSIALACTLPAASYLAIVPLVFALLGFSLHEIKRERAPEGAPWMLVAPAFVGSLGVAGPLLVALEWAFEFGLCAVLGTLAGLVLVPLWPMLVEAPRLARGISLAALVLAAGLVLGARRSPAWSAGHPAPLSLAHFQEAEGGEARWYLDPHGEAPPEGFAGFARGEALRVPRLWGRAPVLQHPAERCERLPAELALASSAPGGREDSGMAVADGTTITLRSARGARMLVLAAPPSWGFDSLRWAKDRELPLSGRHTPLFLAGFGRDELVLQRREAAEGPCAVELFEIDALDPALAQEWSAARGEERVPIGWGDMSIVRTVSTR